MQSGIVRIFRDTWATLPVALFSMRNIVKGSLSVDYLTPTADTADAVDVGYFDDVTWAPARVISALPESASEHPAKIEMAMVTSREQAYREGMYQAACNRFRRKVIKFSTEMDGFIPSFGDLIVVQHDMPGWGQGGEVTAWDAATRTVTLSDIPDDNGPVGSLYYIGLRRADGTMFGPVGVSYGGGPNKLTLASLPDFNVRTDGAGERTHYVFGWGETWGLKARVLSIRPKGIHLVEIEAVNEDYNVHTAENGMITPSQITSQLSSGDAAPAVEGLVVTTMPGDASIMLLSWRPSAYADHYLVEVSPDGINSWSRVGEPRASEHTANAIHRSSTWVRVAAVGLKQGAWSIVQYSAPTIIPWDAVAANFTVSMVNSMAELSWDTSNDLNVKGYEIRVGDDTWEDSEAIVTAHGSSSFSWQPTSSNNFKFWLKAIDVFGDYSLASATALLSGEIPTPSGLVVTSNQGLISLAWNDPGFVNLRHTEVWRNTAETLTGATMVGSTSGLTYTDAPLLDGTYYYWIRFVSKSWFFGPCDTVEGTVGVADSFNLRTVIVFLYKRAATIPDKPTTESTYTFATGELVGHDNDWLQSIPEVDGNPLWLIQATATADAADDVIPATEWSDQIKFVVDGMSQATIYLYQRSAAAPAVTDIADPLTYTFATGVLAGATGAWSRTVPAGTLPLYVITAAAISSIEADTIARAEWSAPTIMAGSGLNSAVVFLYRRYATAPTKPSTTSTYTFSTGALTGQNNSWTQSIPATDGNPLWVIQSTAAATAPTDTDTILAAEWGSQIKVSEDGAAGLNQATIYLYKRASSAPTTSGITSAITYTFATGVSSTTGINGWARGIPAGADPLYVISAVAISADTTDSIGTTEWSTPVKMVENGAIGAQGATGLTGEAGSDGVSTYTWIAYANNSTGTSGFTTGSWSGQTYIGLANNQATATESTNPALYIWSLIKGDQGVPGTPGEDGLPTYTWFAYANNSTGTSGFTTGAWTNQTYLGISANQATATESTNPALYTWSLIQGATGAAGATGATGEAGSQGPTGPAGTTLYTWIAYATNSTGTTGFTTGAWTNQTYIGIANNKTTSVESSTPGDYIWSLIKGDQGVPGTPGDDGTTTYTWFAYATNSTGTIGFTTGAWTNQTYLGIAANQTTATESTNPALYSWSLIKGATGDTGPTGPTGTTGTSARRAYIDTTSGSPPATPSATTGSTSLPSGYTATPSTPATGHYVYQSDGLYDYSTNIVTWTQPYLSNLKVGSLEAITATMGNLSAGTITMNGSGYIRGGKSSGVQDTVAGYFMGYEDGVYKFFFSNNAWSLTTGRGILWDGATLTIKGTINGSEINGSTISASTISIGTTGSGIGGAKFYCDNTAGVVYIEGLTGKYVIPINSDTGTTYRYQTSAVVKSYASGDNSGVAGISSGTSTYSHGVRGINQNCGAAGIVGGANSFCFYADGIGSDYGTFTGAHDVLIDITDTTASVGDLMVDIECITRRDY
jgi:hypothetical protein